MSHTYRRQTEEFNQTQLQKKMIKELEIKEEKIVKTYLVHPSYIRERFSIDVDSLIK